MRSSSTAWNRRSRALRGTSLIAASFALGLILSACSSSKDSGSDGTGGGSGASSSGTVKIGFVNQTAGSVGTYPEITASFDATVAYINKELNGVGGKKIVLDKCVVDGTPATTQRCAQQMVNDKPNFVIWGNDYNSPVAWPILKAANQFVVGELPLSPGDFSATNVVFFNSGTAGSGPATAAYLEKHPTTIKKIGSLNSQNPAAQNSAKILAGTLKAAGFEYAGSDVSPTATDYTSALLALKPKDIGGIGEQLAENGCVALANAYAEQRITTPVLANQTCYSPSVLKSAGKNMVGWKVTELTADQAGDTPDAELYRKIASQYAVNGEKVEGGQAALAFSTMMTTYNNILKPLAGKDITPASVEALVKGPAKTGKITLGGDYSCGAVKILPTVCGLQVFMYGVGPGPDYKLQVLPEQTDPIDVTDIITRAFPNGLPS
jgi:branched-chain amino acid transport system substrate-binding protein